MAIGTSTGEAAMNVAGAERWASAIGGGALVLYGLFGRRSLGGGLLAALGASLAYRGVSGHCPLYSALGVDTTRREHASERSTSEVIESASEDSFPASDAPAWTPTTSVGEFKR